MIPIDSVLKSDPELRRKTMLRLFLNRQFGNKADRGLPSSAFSSSGTA
jgi:hypothetical protein